jgi:hypothetical protein
VRLGYALGGVCVSDRLVHELDPERVQKLASDEVIFPGLARGRGLDALGQRQQPGPISAGTDQPQRTTKVIEVDRDHSISAGPAAPQYELTDVGDVIVTDIVQDTVAGDYVRDLRVYGPLPEGGDAPLLIQLRLRATTRDKLEVTAPPQAF